MAGRTLSLSTLLAAGLLLLGATGLYAQRRPQVPRETLRASGTIEGVAPGVLKVVTKDGGQWLIKVPEKPQDVSLTGTATPEWLQRGMFVRFSSRFDQKGKAQAPIRELQVFTPSEADRIGVFPDVGVGGAKLFGEEKAEQPAAQPREQVVPYFVAGRLVGFKNGKLSVLAGNTPVQAEVDEKVQVTVNVSDYRLARKGDRVEMEAWYPAGQKAAGLAVATRLKISGATPFAPASKTTRRPPRRGAKAAADEPVAEQP